MASDLRSSYPIDSPPEVLSLPVTARRNAEKSAVREAIVSVCEAAVGEKGSRLLELLAAIEEKDGPKAAFDSIIKLLEFSQPKLQRVVDSTGGDVAPAMPVFNINLGGAGLKVVEIEGQVADGD